MCVCVCDRGVSALQFAPLMLTRPAPVKAAPLLLLDKVKQGRVSLALPPPIGNCHPIAPPPIQLTTVRKNRDLTSCLVLITYPLLVTAYINKMHIVLCVCVCLFILPEGFDRRPPKVFPLRIEGAESLKRVGNAPSLVPRPPETSLVKLVGKIYSLKCR